MLNIHPSILPLFPGLDTHARALAAGMAVHGCTVHEVTSELDSGPILGQAVLPVEAGRHAGEPRGAAAADGAPALSGGAAAVRAPGTAPGSDPRMTPNSSDTRPLAKAAIGSSAASEVASRRPVSC